MTAAEDSQVVFNVAQVAALYRVTIQTVYRWINAGHLETFRTPGGQLRVVVGPSAQAGAMVAEGK